MTEIPIDPTIPRQSLRVTLDSKDYVLTVRYNTRTDSYWLDLTLADGTAVIQGVHVVANWPLLRNRTGRNFPPGDLLCISDTGETPRYEELGASARLIYNPA